MTTASATGPAPQPLAFDKPSRHRQNQRPRELGGRLGQHIRCVGHDDVSRVSGGDVDVVVTDGDVGDDLQIRRRRQHVCIHWIGQDADQPLLALQPVDELRGRQRRPAVIQLDVAASFELRQDRRGNPAGQEDSRARISVRAIRSSHSGCRKQSVR